MADLALVHPVALGHLPPEGLLVEAAGACPGAVVIEAGEGHVGQEGVGIGQLGEGLLEALEVGTPGLGVELGPAGKGGRGRRLLLPQGLKAQAPDYQVGPPVLPLPRRRFTGPYAHTPQGSTSAPAPPVVEAREAEGTGEGAAYGAPYLPAGQVAQEAAGAPGGCPQQPEEGEGAVELPQGSPSCCWPFLRR